MNIFKTLLVAALGLGVGACATGPSYYDGMVYQDGDYYAPAASGYGDYYLGQDAYAGGYNGGYYGDSFFAPYGYGAPYGWSGFDGYCSVRYRYCPSIGFMDPWQRFDLWIGSGWGWYDPRWNDGWYGGYHGGGGGYYGGGYYGGGYHGGGYYGGGWYGGGGHWSDGRRHRRPRPPSGTPAPAPGPSGSDRREGMPGVVVYVPPPNSGEWETYYDGTTPMPRPGQPSQGVAGEQAAESRWVGRPMPRRVERPRSDWRSERPASSGGSESRGDAGGRAERPARTERSGDDDETPRARRRERDEG